MLQALPKDAKFRANPGYELVPWNRLEAADQRALSVGQADPDTYGVLRPSSGSVATLAVCRETALLFLTLREPGPLPGYVESVFGLEGERGLKRLMLDGVLEVSGPDGYVGGPEACVYLGLDTPLGVGRLARLSQAALQYGQALELSDPLALSRRLYLYNQRPATAEWRRRLRDRAATAEFLGVRPGGSSVRAITRAWRPMSREHGWLFFTARAPKPAVGRSPCKLYVSPAPEALPEALAVVIEALADTEAHQFKVGADLYGVLRPDKLVAYFASKEALLDAVVALCPRLGGIPSHGVPFTAEAGGSLLSWGADPKHLSEIQGYSWRHWITNRLAAALVAAQDTPPSSLEPWRFALERLHLEGIDPETFSPTSSWTGARTR